MSKFIKKYFDFIKEDAGAAEPATKPAQPTIKPGTKPHTPTKPHQPGKKPGPSVDPRPKAKATEKEVTERFINELKNLGNMPVENFDYDSIKKRWKNNEKKD